MSELGEIIREEIRAGTDDVRTLHELALYHPTLGYYAGGGGRSRWAERDYSRVGMSRAVGLAMARRLRQMWEMLTGRSVRGRSRAGTRALLARMWRAERGPDGRGLRYIVLIGRWRTSAGGAAGLTRVN
jgi:hypothetical protein